MALSKTIQYTPFEETSFGYGSGEIAAAFPALTNCKVIMKVDTAPSYWDQETGHISTPKSGAASSSFHKLQQEWRVAGSVADVDAILAQLVFFPSDYEQVRTWEPTPLKDNVITGDYGLSEEPSLVWYINDTTLTMFVYDGNDVLQSVEGITFEAIQPVYGNQRPFWTVEPTSQDAAGVEYDTVAGGLLDFGTISHGLDTENVQVKCEFRHYLGSIYTGTAYGSMTQETNVYVADKKPNTRNTSDSRFNFTGTLSEAQSFLDSVRYSRNGNTTAFDMFLTITDGVVGSTLKKTIWFSDAPVIFTAPSNQNATEEQILYIDASAMTLLLSPDDGVDWQAELILDATGVTVVKNVVGGTLVGDTITFTGVSFASLKEQIEALQFEFYDDLTNDFAVQVRITTSNPSIGSVYQGTQTFNVFIQGTPEISTPFSSHTYTEDTRYYFNGNLPNIAHTFNDDFIAEIQPSDVNAVEVMWSTVGTGGVDFVVDGVTKKITITGDRDTVNSVLNGLYFEPATDYDSPFTFSYTQTRTSGDPTGWYNTPVYLGTSMGMTGIGHDEYSATNPTVQWYEDFSKIFDSGVRVTDLSDEQQWTLSYGTTYTVRARLRQAATTNPVTDAILTTVDPGSLTISGNGQVGTELTMTGTKTDINAALAAIKLIPFADYSEQIYAEYEIQRDFDSAILGNYADIYTILAHNDAENYSWVHPSGYQVATAEDTVIDIDTGVRITDNATLNTDYGWGDLTYTVTMNANWWDGATEYDETNVNLWYPGSTGQGHSGNPFVFTGTKDEVNTMLAALRIIPTTPDWEGEAASTYFNFYVYVNIVRNQDSEIITNNNVWTAFLHPTLHNEYYSNIQGITYTEDAFGEYIFAGHDIGISDLASSVDPHIGRTTTYEVDITLSPTDVGHFGSGVTTVNLSGSKETVNQAIQDLQFYAYPDTNASVDIIYSQRQYIDTVLTNTHATTVNVATVDAVPVAEVTLGTANGNIQYFVQDEFLYGLDLTQTRPTILNNNAYTYLIPNVLTQNQGFIWERPLTINDSFNEEGGASQYRLLVTGSDLPAGSALQTTDSGWLPKEYIHGAIENGVPVVGVNASNANIPAHNSTFTINLEVQRKTFSGVETTIWTGSLTYKFLTGIEVWGYDGTTTGLNVQDRVQTTAYDFDWSNQTATKDDGPFDINSAPRVLFFYGSNKEALPTNTYIDFAPHDLLGGYDYIYRFNHENVTADNTQWILTATYTASTWQTQFGIRAWTPWGTEIKFDGPNPIYAKHNV